MDRRVHKKTDDLGSRIKKAKLQEKRQSRNSAESAPAESFRRVSAGAHKPGDVIALQGTVGNKAVQRVLAESIAPNPGPLGGSETLVQQEEDDSPVLNRQGKESVQRRARARGVMKPLIELWKLAPDNLKGRVESVMEHFNPTDFSLTKNIKWGEREK